jgi:hypothetical protein
MWTAATHRPLVGVAPHARACLFDVLGAEEGQGRLCRDELNLDILMLAAKSSVEIAGYEHDTVGSSVGSQGRLGGADERGEGLRR